MPCNFCTTRYGCQRPQEQDNDAELLKEVERLRLLIKRTTGKEEGVSFTDLEAIESQLKGVMLVVRDLKKKTKAREEEDERLHLLKQDMDHPVPSASSSQGCPENHHGGTPLLKMKRDFDRQNAESLQSEFDRLWLRNERMNGRELHGMTSFDLLHLELQISRALVALSYQMIWPRKEQIARPEEKPISRLPKRERCDTDDGTPSQHRQFSVSRELRRLR